MAAEKDLAHRLVDNVYLTIVSRYATPALLAAVLWFGGDFVESQRKAVQAMGERADQIEDLIGKMEPRLAVLERRADDGRKAREDLTTQVLTELKETRAAITTLTSRVSALEATVQTALRTRADLGRQLDPNL